MVVKLGDKATVDAAVECARELASIMDNPKNIHIEHIIRDEQIHCTRISISPPCECAICGQQYRPQAFQRRGHFVYGSAVSNQEAENMTAEFITSTNENYEHLRQICRTYGNAIIKRWKKKSIEKRQSLLLEVDPDMYAEKYPDVRLSLDFARLGLAFLGVMPGDARRSYRNVLLLPYLNLRSMKEDSSKLLNLLYNRMAYTSEQWSSFDNHLLDKQWKIGALETTYHASCVIMHGTSYGKLTDWTKTAAHAWDIVGFPRAILILEAQMKLSKFLRAAVDKILHGVRESKDSDTSFQILNLGLKKNTNVTTCIEFASAFLNQPFSAPPLLDAKKLLTVAEKQVNLHGDHLWLLQTDPLSLRHYTALVLEGIHQLDLESQKQYTVAVAKLLEDSTTFWTWEWILQEIQQLENLATRFRDSVYPGKPLPRLYARSLACLEALLVGLVKTLANQMLSIIPIRPGFREKYKWNKRLSPRNMVQHRIEDDLFIDTFNEDPLEFCLLSLAVTLLSREFSVNEKINYELHEASEIFAILDDHLYNTAISGKKQELARLDEILYMSYSDLSALYQILSMVRFHRPCVPEVSLHEAIETESGKAWRCIKAGYLDVDYKDKNIGTTLANGSRLMSQFLETSKPTGSRASQKWLQYDAEQRDASRRLWSEIRNTHRKTLRNLGIGNDDIELDLLVLSADTAPKHIADLQLEHEKIQAAILANEHRQQKKRHVSLPEYRNQWDSNDQKQNSNPKKQAKLKVKRRSDQHVENREPKLEDLSISDKIETAPPVKVAVTKRTLEILQALYPKPNFEERTKSLDWASFVYGMAEVGFVAKQVHGSEYSFEPTPTCKWYGRGRIVIHKPHPEPKYEAWKLLGIGKRMAKWFDWSADTFELLEVK